MKKRFSFLVCLLFTYVAASFAQVNPEPELTLKFSSDDGVIEYWYYINFNRRQNTAWTLDHSFSSEVQSITRATGNHAQQWKLIGDRNSFYFVNRDTEELMAYTGLKIEDSYGKTTPNRDAHNDVYYADEPVTPETAAKLRVEWRSETTAYGLTEGWVFLNNDLGGTSYMNDRAGQNACNYGFLDTGDIIFFLLADTKIIGVVDRSLTRDGLVNNTSIMSFDVTTMNITTAVTGTITGPDASAFGFGEGGNTITGRDNTLFQFNITFLPTETGKEYEATLTLTAEGAEDVTIALKGTAFDASELPVQFSTDTDEHWYYIQFTRKAAANLVWASSEETRYVVQDTLKGGEENFARYWKICGNWEQGYYLVNRATGAELLYNTRKDVQPGEETRIFTDVASANYYVLPPAGEQGNDFEFVRYAGQGASGKSWQLLNRSIARYSYPNYKYINDSGGANLTMYTLGDTGNELTFIPADQVAIIANNATLTISATEGEEATATFNVGGATNTSADIAVTITGSDEGVFAVSPATIPASGGELTITFTPPAGGDPKQYLAFLRLSTPGADDVVVPVAGMPTILAPMVSTDESEYWYYLQFTRRPAVVWQGNGEAKISQVAMAADKQSQHWKFVEAEEGGYYVVNREEGGLMYYVVDEDGDEDGDAFLGDAGTPVEFVESEGTWQLHILQYFESGNTYGFVNDFQGTRVCIYFADDGGNYLKFMPADVETYYGTGIKQPDLAIDANDTVIATKYYNLQGMEVSKPNVTGIYIVRKLYASGKAQATKMFVKVW